MTHDPLDYQSTHPPKSIGFVAAAWTMLLTAGILCCLVSAGAFGLSLLAVWVGFAEGNIDHSAQIVGPLAETVIVLALLLGSGIVYIAAAIPVKHRSHRAARIARFVAIINIVASLLLLIQLAASALAAGIRDAGDFLFAVVVGVAIAGVNVLIAWLLTGMLRDSQGQPIA